jgi:hypothetical protein
MIILIFAYELTCVQNEFSNILHLRPAIFIGKQPSSNSFGVGWRLNCRNAIVVIAGNIPIANFVACHLLSI